MLLQSQGNRAVEEKAETLMTTNCRKRKLTCLQQPCSVQEIAQSGSPRRRRYVCRAALDHEKKLWSSTAAQNGHLNRLLRNWQVLSATPLHVLCVRRGQRRNEELQQLVLRKMETHLQLERKQVEFCFLRYGAEQNERGIPQRCRIQVIEGQQGQSTLSSPPED